MGDLVEEFIYFIKDLVNDEFDYCIDYVDSEYYFLHGGCLEFAKVLHYYLNGSYIVIRDDLEHFAVWYNDNYYDVTGKINSNHLYRRLSEKEILSIEHYYGNPEVNFSDLTLINEINCCSGDYAKKLLCKIHRL